MIQIEYLPIVLTGIGIIASILYYASVLRNQNRTRQAQLFMNIYETYRSPEFRRQVNDIRSQEWTDFDDWWSKYGQDTNPDAWASWMSVAAYFDGVGVLLKKNLIDIDLVDELLSNTVFGTYRRMEKPLKEWRKRVDRSMSTHEILEGFDYLQSELMKRAKPVPSTGHDRTL